MIRARDGNKESRPRRRKARPISLAAPPLVGDVVTSK